MDDAALLKGVSKHYIYKMTSGNIIPYYKPNGGIVTSKEKNSNNGCINRIPSNVEIDAQAIRIIAKK